MSCFISLPFRMGCDFDVDLCFIVIINLKKLGAFVSFDLLKDDIIYLNFTRIDFLNVYCLFKFID